MQRSRDKGGAAGLDLVRTIGAHRCAGQGAAPPLIRAAGRGTAGLRVSKAKKGFLIQGKDAPGAVHRHIQKLADERINVTAADAVCAGKGRYGMILWVKPGQYRKATRVLRAR